jgi:hypothetical protein
MLDGRYCLLSSWSKQEQLTTPGRREERAVWTNRQFMRSNLDTPEHFASRWVDLYDVKFII